MYPGEFTRGRRELLDILKRTQVVYVAARCRVTRNAVYGWTSGQRRPAKASQRALEANYGIAPDAWDRPARYSGGLSG